MNAHADCEQIRGECQAEIEFEPGVAARSPVEVRRGVVVRSGKRQEQRAYRSDQRDQESSARRLRSSVEWGTR